MKSVDKQSRILRTPEAFEKTLRAEMARLD
jgi:hypothetical protein